MERRAPENAAVVIALAGIALLASATAADSPTLTGQLAFGDWRSDSPGVRRHIRVADLPAPYASDSAGRPPRITTPPAGALPTVPADFSVKRYLTGLRNPRIVRVAPNGDIFVAETSADRIRVLRPGASGAPPALVQLYATGLDEPFGMAFYPAGPNPSWLYVANHNSVLRFAYQNGDLAARGKPETIVAELSPTSGGHSTRDLVFSADGQRLLVSVGSQSNVAQGIGRKSAAELRAHEARSGLGAAWGNETRRAAVLAFAPDGRAETRAFATGLRNCVGLARQSATGAIWCATNERDGLGDDLVPDYATRIRAGAFFGWPWYYLGANVDPNHGAAARPDLAGKVSVPDVLLQSHSAALGIVFYERTTGAALFPANYRGDAFVALHGSWNREFRTGYKVVRLLMNNGVPTGAYEDFMTGFVIDAFRVWGRPVGVAVAADGALLVSDDGSGTLWRVSPE